jgi:hypothetical protein
MKKMRICFPREKTFEDGFKEYILTVMQHSFVSAQFDIIKTLWYHAIINGLKGKL